MADLGDQLSPAAGLDAEGDHDSGQDMSDAIDADLVHTDQSPIEDHDIHPDLRPELRQDLPSDLQLQVPPYTGGDIFHNPPNLGSLRRRLFEVKETIELRMDEFRRYWPYVDNVWVRQRSTASQNGAVTTEYYMCRLRRPTSKPKGSPSAPAPEARTPLRKKPTREGGTCGMKLKVVHFEGVYSSCTITRLVGDDVTHTHNLDFIDKIKRNSIIMDIGRREAVKGYLASSVFAIMHEDPQRLQDAGGKFMTTTDIRNASHAWRTEHPNQQLIPHPGYEYKHGNGIVKTSNNQPVASSLPQQFMNGNVPPQQPPAQMTSGSQLPPDTLFYPPQMRSFLDAYLPKSQGPERKYPHVTLTYATSMDAAVSLAPGMQTILSGPESKAMTHYLRSRHDAILIGVGTAVADDPGLNCRLEGAGGYGGFGWDGQPRPVIIDPMARWSINQDTRILRTVRQGKGRAPWIVISPASFVDPQTLMLLKSAGGNYLRIAEYNVRWRLTWDAILTALAAEGIKSVMIEGGGTILSELLNPEYSSIVDSVIVTVAPTFLGRGGVVVSPERKQDETGRPKAALRLRNVRWQPMGEDVVMCGHMKEQT